MSTWVWVVGATGAPVPAADAMVPALDRGLLLGEGVYETCKVIGDTPFALTRHLARLRRSAAIVGIEVPWDDDVLRSSCAQVVASAAASAAASGMPWPGGLGRLRITVTGGAAPLGPGGRGEEPGLVLAAGPGMAWPSPSRVATVPWARNRFRPSAGAKSISAVDDVLALAEARRHGADEAVLADTSGSLSEGTGSNVFVVLGGVLMTPSLSTGCLPGITRELVGELVDVEEVVERDDLTLDDLRGADEAFLTSSTRDVQPIGWVDGVALAEVPGPVTARVADAFAELQRASLDP